MADPTSRPDVPATHPDPEEHRRQLARRANASFCKDGSNAMTMPAPLKSCTVADLATDALDPSLWEGAQVYVSNESGGAVIAFSDGSDWRRVTDRAVVSA